MPILIDGYNLLHAAGIIPRGVGRGTLAAARRALLNWLVSSLEPEDVRETTVVFDGADPPRGLPREFEHQGLTVCFSTGYENADAMLEELIRKSTVPKSLLVVSSDHRVQRAARRRRAEAVDSDAWYFGIREQSRCPPCESPTGPPAKPTAPLDAADVQQWLDEFSDLIDELGDLDSLAAALPTDLPPAQDEDGAPRKRKQPRPEEPKPKGAKPRAPKSKGPGRSSLDDLANPFPPGYGEDLLEPGADLD